MGLTRVQEETQRPGEPLARRVVEVDLEDAAAVVALLFDGCDYLRDIRLAAARAAAESLRAGTFASAGAVTWTPAK